MKFNFLKSLSRWLKSDKFYPIDKTNSGISELYKQFDSSQADINYLDLQYQEFISKSLELDFNSFKEYIDNGGICSISPRNAYAPQFGTNFKAENFWHMCDVQNDEFVMYKSSEDVRIDVGFRYTEKDRKFEITRCELYIEKQRAVNLDKKQFEDILHRYYAYTKLKTVNKNKEHKKQSFQKMMNLIGKDIKRDSILEEILKD